MTVAVASRDVLSIARQYGGSVQVKDIAELLGVEDQRDVANRCGYLVTGGFMERISPGVFQATDKPDSEPMKVAPGEYGCDMCDRTGFKTPHAVVMHKTRSHSKPKSPAPTTKAAKAAQADELFEMVGRATEALFPKGVPMSRIIEIAELQKAMLKVVSR